MTGRRDVPVADERQDSEPTKLLRSRLLGRNAALNFIGMASPAILVAAAIPVLIDQLGVERFGVLALAWALVGSFGLFDVGLGRALTQEAAAALGRNREREVPRIARAYLRFMLLAGLVGAFALALLAPVLTELLHLPRQIRDESTTGFILLAVAVPFVVVTTGLRGLLEAYQRFGVLTAIRIPLNVATFMGPVAVALVTQNLAVVLLTLLVTRILGAAAHLQACRRTVPSLFAQDRTGRLRFSRIWRSAKWMAVTNLVGPLMVLLDRFAIGFALSASAVAYYAAPSDVLTRIAIVPLSVIGVLFPAFATSFARDPRHAAGYFNSSCRLLATLLIPPTLIIFVFAPDILEAWLDPSFAERSAGIMRWLSVGVILNAIGQVPFAYLQAIGRADFTGRLHLVELPVYVAGLVLVLEFWGLEGVAVLWTVRAALDGAALFYLAHRAAELSRRGEARALLGVVFTLVPTSLCMLLSTNSGGARALAFIIGGACFALSLRYWLVEPSEWRALRRAARNASSHGAL